MPLGAPVRMSHCHRCWWQVSTVPSYMPSHSGTSWCGQIACTAKYSSPELATRSFNPASPSHSFRPFGGTSLFRQTNFLGIVGLAELVVADAVGGELRLEQEHADRGLDRGRRPGEVGANVPVLAGHRPLRYLVHQAALEPQARPAPQRLRASVLLGQRERDLEPVALEGAQFLEEESVAHGAHAKEHPAVVALEIARRRRAREDRHHAGNTAAAGDAQDV